MDDALNLENRRKIYQYIAQNPGTYLREMERALSMQPGVLSYHLDVMEKRGLIKSEDDGYIKRYFPAEKFKQRDRRIVSLLRQESPRKILLHMLLNGSSSFQSLTNAVGLSKSTLSYHLKKLTSAGIIFSKKVEREFVYGIENPDEIANLLITLQESLESDAVDRFVDIWRKLGK